MQVFSLTVLKERFWLSVWYAQDVTEGNDKPT